MWKAVILIFCLTLVGCNPQTSSVQAGEEKVELAAYSVPPGMQESIKDVLNRNFQVVSDEGQSAIAWVEVLPNGQLALVGPVSVHEGMKALIKDMENRTPPPVENARLDFWMVLANGSEEISFGEGLKGMESVLAEITQGEKMSFTILERLRTSAAIGTEANAKGNFFRVDHTLAKSGGGNLAQISIRSESGADLRLDTRIYLQQNKFTVLGESGIRVHKGIAEELGVSPGYYTLFYIFKAQTESAGF